MGGPGPEATSIVPATTGPTNDDSVGFVVTFSEGVERFDTVADLEITHSGTSSTGATFAGGLVVYEVTVTGITGDGSFTLAVSSTTDILDSDDNSLVSSVASAAVAVDNTPPTVSIGAPSVASTSTGPVSFLVNYSDAAPVNLSASDIVLNRPGNTLGTISVSDGMTTSPTITVESILGTGTQGITIGAGTASDTLGNATTSVTTSTTFSVSNDPLPPNPLAFDYAVALAGVGEAGAYAVGFDGSGNTYVTGYFSGTIDFDPGVVEENPTAAGGEDAFVVKLDEDDNLVWVQALGDVGDDFIFDIAVSDGGAVYLAGEFEGKVDFDPGAGIEEETSVGGGYALVLHLDTNGAFGWVTTVGGDEAKAKQC